MNASALRRLSGSLTILLLLTLSIGCGGKIQPPPPSPELTALSLEEWKSLPLDVKYDGATFDRLRMNDPRLQDERFWMSYMATHIIPERKKDIPGVPGHQPPETPK